MNTMNYQKERNINIHRYRKEETELSDELFSDLNRIIEKLKRHGDYRFDEYEIHISLKDSIDIIRVFENNPENIKNEMELNDVIKILSTCQDRDIISNIPNIFKVFISINHDGYYEEFNDEYGIPNEWLKCCDTDNPRYITDCLPIDKICDIINNELDWMGLYWKFVTRNNIIEIKQL